MGQFEIIVSEDNLTAFLRITEAPAAEGAVAEIKQLLAAKGICHGVVPDETMETYLADPFEGKKELEIARGKGPVAGNDARIVYYFDTDPLKIGTVRHGGIIDYRDRGEIPQVRKGELLARKEPASPGTSGIDVFGKTLSPPHLKDVKIKCGKGAVKTGDGMKAHAALNGGATLSSDGKISVFPRLRIPGDVDLHSGHVKFDGDVDVAGSVQDGFRVEAGRLTAGDILRADITVSGDIVISGGIIGATIRGDGNLKARFIHRARIHLLGDVVVEKEIIDSDILTNGALLVPTGKVFNSRLCAKGGIEAGQIGSEESRACRLEVGEDVGAGAKIEHLRTVRKQKKKKMKQLHSVITKLERMSKRLQKKIDTLVQQEDYSAELCMSQQVRVNAKRDEMSKKIEAFQDERETLKQDIAEIREWSQSSGGNPSVKVEGTIYAHTIVKGSNTGTQLSRNLTRTIIKERSISPAEDRKQGWKLVAVPLK